MHLVTVFQTFSPVEAQLVRSRLEAAGYQAQVRNELASLSMEGYSMAAGGVLVEVPDDVAGDARDLLTAAPISGDGTE